MDNKELFYWKYPELEMLSKVDKFISIKIHHTLFGFITILIIIYSYNNKRSKPL